MLAWPRVLAARSLFGLLAPPKALELDDCGRLFCCEPDGLAAGCVVDAGLEAGCVDAAGREPCVLPVEGRVAAVLLVFGRVPPDWLKPRSPEGFLAGAEELGRVFAAAPGVRFAPPAAPVAAEPPLTALLPW